MRHKLEVLGSCKEVEKEKHGLSYWDLMILVTGKSQLNFIPHSSLT